MAYSYSVCFCRECQKMNLSDRSSYDNNKDYCTQYERYININDKACCIEHFVYDENRNNQTSNGSCYITTIVCTLMGMEDNSIYLEKLRNFRENYMKKDINMIPILLEYDIIGPMIAKKLMADSFKNIRALMMLENYIKPIVKMIDEQKYTEAINKYQEMTNQLKDFYKIETPIINIDISDINIDDIGKGHKLVLKNKEI